MIPQHIVKSVQLMVQIGILFLSAIAWVLFTISFSVLYHSMASSFKDSEAKGNKAILGLTTATQVLFPAWLAIVSYPLVFTVRTLLIFLSRPNWRHCTHAILMALTFFYTLGSVLVIALGTVLLSSGVIGKLARSTFYLQSSQLELKRMLAGVVCALLLYWISLVVAPLLELKRRRYHDYQELLDTSTSINTTK